jgi:hypothetical protein
VHCPQNGLDWEVLVSAEPVKNLYQSYVDTILYIIYCSNSGVRVLLYQYVKISFKKIIDNMLS